jgi:hypothetical protein
MWYPFRVRIPIAHNVQARLCVEPFYLDVADGPGAVREGVAFDVSVPVPRQAIATYRVADPGAGIKALFR